MKSIFIFKDEPIEETLVVLGLWLMILTIFLLIFMIITKYFNRGNIISDKNEGIKISDINNIKLLNRCKNNEPLTYI